MELSTITEDRGAARKAFLEYRQAVRERHDAEDEQIMRGYRELASGRQLIRLPDTIRLGGVDVAGRPRMAVCRADGRVCRLYVQHNGTVTFLHEDTPMWQSRVRRAKRITVESVVPAGVRFETGDVATAIVPTIPPPLRPAGKLDRFHILWEAEWRRAAPRDPALIRHIGGDLWAVLAVWDLTELERVVLAGRVDTA
jgi:hypothetical protein